MRGLVQIPASKNSVLALNFYSHCLTGDTHYYKSGIYMLRKKVNPEKGKMQMVYEKKNIKEGRKQVKKKKKLNERKGRENYRKGRENIRKGGKKNEK